MAVSRRAFKIEPRGGVTGRQLAGLVVLSTCKRLLDVEVPRQLRSSEDIAAAAGKLLTSS